LKKNYHNLLHKTGYINAKIKETTYIKNEWRGKMTLLYIVVAGILGLIFFGPVGAVIGGVIGIVFGATQSNYSRIVKLEKEVNDLKNNKS
jgi:hypothetical protein